MPVNLDKPERWKEDVAQSVDLYNQWFISSAPPTFIRTRRRTTKAVEEALIETADLTDISSETLAANPGILPILRMATAPPIARDRLIGLAGVPSSLVGAMEGKVSDLLIARLQSPEILPHLESIGHIVQLLVDQGLFPWLKEDRRPSEAERHRASIVVADRLCGAQANPLLRNAQEAWQLEIIAKWLEARGYTKVSHGTRFSDVPPGQFAFRLNAMGKRDDGKRVNIPIDAVIMPLTAKPGSLPLLVEAKSAGDLQIPISDVKKRLTKCETSADCTEQVFGLSCT